MLRAALRQRLLELLSP
ncbi:MAG: hypothetical protein MGAcid_19830 [uncultured Acidilobus sp. MG]|nr:MAG: hypothetical protein MGAcid_19830 [uncultured Acidilobus sp. MG]